MNRPIPPYAANVSLDDDRYSNNDERRCNKHPTRFVQHKLKSAETCTLLWGNRSINDIHEYSMASSSPSSSSSSRRTTMLVRKSLSPSCLRRKKQSLLLTANASEESDDGGGNFSSSSGGMHRRTSSSSSAMMRKSVSFGGIEWYQVPRIEREDDINATWYNRNEYMEIKKTIQHTAKLIRRQAAATTTTTRSTSGGDDEDVNGTDDYDNEELCTRGLELLAFPSIRRRRHEEIEQSLDAVLSLQERISRKDDNKTGSGNKSNTTSSTENGNHSATTAATTVNANLLAQMYKVRTYRSLAAAQRTAMIDAKNVEQLWKTTTVTQAPAPTVAPPPSPTPPPPAVGRDLPPKLPERKR